MAADLLLVRTIPKLALWLSKSLYRINHAFPGREINESNT
ncbi:hypothetical protein MGWOODY_XGa30 [hydrothermal vent metagenome]|uniref:Uncharacterized protein n=1 Tax=hydrothermal vent metagenome TaxID=652676 RepID=A0A160TUI6_9ZZZZ